MVKTMTLVNKDVSNQLLLKNILTPPEAIELTKLYNQLGTILKKPQKKSPNAGDQINDYYKMLFRFMKLLSRLQFGETPAPSSENPPVQEIPHQIETPWPLAESSQINVEHSTQDADDFHSQENMLDDDMSVPQIPPYDDEEEKEKKEETDESFSPPRTTPSPPQETKPTNIAEKVAKYMNIKLETFKRKPEYTLLNFLKDADGTFQMRPNNTFIIKGSKFDLDTILDTVHAMQDSEAELDETQTNLVKAIHDLTLSSGVNAEKILAKFPMLMSSITDEKRQSRSQAKLKTAARPIPRESVVTSKGPAAPKHIGNGRGKKRPLGSVDFTNWQKNIKKVRV